MATLPGRGFGTGAVRCPFSVPPPRPEGSGGVLVHGQRVGVALPAGVYQPAEDLNVEPGRGPRARAPLHAQREPAVGRRPHHRDDAGRRPDTAAGTAPGGSGTSVHGGVQDPGSGGRGAQRAVTLPGDRRVPCGTCHPAWRHGSTLRGRSCCLQPRTGQRPGYPPVPVACRADARTADCRRGRRCRWK